MGAFTAYGNVVLKGNNVTLSFEDIEANFSPSLKGSGLCGTLYLADPLDACSPLTNKVVPGTNETRSPFVLITRGGCSFDDKVRSAQAAGFQAAIVYDNENGPLVASTTLSCRQLSVKFLRYSAFVQYNFYVSCLWEKCLILIYALLDYDILYLFTMLAVAECGWKFCWYKDTCSVCSKDSGETLAKYAGATDMELWIVPSFENSAWSIMAISFISLLAMSAVLATCFFVRRHRIRRERPQAPRVREFHGMSSRLVKAMPSLIFTAVLEDNCTSATCAICLEDYTMGEKLRILPCRHKFHAICVDAWLTSWRTFCPVCKRDARTSTGEPPASESTPLLSPSSSVLSSVRSSLVSSSVMQIGRSYSRSPSVSRPQSISTTPHNHHSQSHQQSSYLSTSQSSVARGAYLVSPHSLGYPSLSSLNSRYMSPYIPSSVNASSSYVGSSSRQANALHYSESAASLSPFASAQSLPDC
ncbi:Receptor homology region, transmembrane domain- and RING domain-containing protein 2 [Sesamum angolense]|uniref:Receptor homology region, transmembrane domain-and RING domain-containing protein 2 n=1 Tax=Sesamum angolense TaxID=2727404 RepID=A0AAE1WDB2_9LAMI|nr:Receptor homology region, transmembrane domain- and RING domain-containing protein 2 [Sesamum angolense]